MVDSVIGSSTAAATEGPSNSAASLGKLAGDFDDFLKLLVTQLKNQDPTSPLDTNQFTQQIVSFAGVEQQINSNKKLEQLIAATNVSQNSNLISFIGKDVEIESASIALESVGNVSFSYILDEPAQNVFVTVRDSQNNTVFNGGGATTLGRNNALWDGTDNNGDRLPPGLYQVFVTAEDLSDNLANVSTLVRGRVIGANLNSESPTLIVNGEEITLGEVKFVGEAI